MPYSLSLARVCDSSPGHDVLTTRTRNLPGEVVELDLPVTGGLLLTLNARIYEVSDKHP